MSNLTMTLLEYINKYKFSVTEFADFCKIHRVTMSYYIHKTKSPSLERAIVIVKATGGLVQYEDLSATNGSFPKCNQPRNYKKINKITRRKNKLSKKVPPKESLV